MNEKREKLNTFEYSRAPLEHIERETSLVPLAEISINTNDTERDLTPLSSEDTAVYATRFEVDTTPVPERLTHSQRASYLLRGTGWSVATLAAFGLNSVVLFFDAGLLNLLFTTTGYLAYKQFKAAATGTAHTCLKFVCTLQTVKKNVSKVVSAMKNKITGAPSLPNCVGCVA